MERIDEGGMVGEWMARGGIWLEVRRVEEWMEKEERECEA